VSSGAVPLSRVETVGVAGIPDVAVELGRMTALIGTRASGKSQLLTAIAWLLSGEPLPGMRAGVAELRVRGDAMGARGPARLVRAMRASGEITDRPRPEEVPACSFLQAADRLGAPPIGSAAADTADARVPRVDGRTEVGERMRALLPARTTDAAAADALVRAVESCCREGFEGEVLIIEEPELLLTPQAQRYLYALLRRFAEGGNQVVYSTWSPAFVDAARHEEIVRLDLGEGAVVLRRTDPGTLSDAERVRIQAEFDHERSEMFFAQKVVLVEGQTERLSLPFVFRAMGHDPDAEGIAIVEMGGKGNLPLAARLLGQLAIPFVVVFDADHGTPAAMLDAEIRRAAHGAPTVRLEPDFEGAAGIGSRDEKVLRAWRRFSRARPADIPRPLAEIVRLTVAL
jgi:predicted ATPase